jgi:hypothetical protein
MRAFEIRPPVKSHQLPEVEAQREVVLTNARVLVERHTIEPGQWLGASSAARLLVFITDGVVSTQAGRTTLWKAGRVWWQSAGGDFGETLASGSANSGVSTIDLVSVTLRPVASATRAYEYLRYPNIPGEDLFENDRVIVQRFVVRPGQWEGVHAHCPNMLYIHVKGGRWAARSHSDPEPIHADPAPDGSVGWMPTIGIEEGHESGNVGHEPIDLIWVTLK